MNKNAVYLAIFAALCVLAGVLVGASITKRPDFSLHGPGGPGFREKAERFMGYGPREHRERMGGGGGPIEMFTARLGLNQEQKIKVADILEKTRQEIDQVGENIRGAIDQVREKSDKEIMSILTPEQQKKFKTLQGEFSKGYGLKGPGEKRGPKGERRLPPGEELPLPQE